MAAEPEMSSVLVEENKMAALGRLLAGIIHEINTPMGSISSNNQVLLRSLELVKKALADPHPAALNRARDIVDTCVSLAVGRPHRLRADYRADPRRQDLLAHRHRRAQPRGSQRAAPHRAEAHAQRVPPPHRGAHRFRRTAAGGVLRADARPGVPEPAGQRGPGHRGRRPRGRAHAPGRPRSAHLHLRHRPRHRARAEAEDLHRRASPPSPSA